MKMYENICVDIFIKWQALQEGMVADKWVEEKDSTHLYFKI